MFWSRDAKPSTHRSILVEVADPGKQPATARRAAEAELRTLIAGLAPGHGRLIAAMRRCRLWPTA